MSADAETIGGHAAPTTDGWSGTRGDRSSEGHVRVISEGRRAVRLLEEAYSLVDAALTTERQRSADSAREERRRPGAGAAVELAENPDQARLMQGISPYQQRLAEDRRGIRYGRDTMTLTVALVEYYDALYRDSAGANSAVGPHLGTSEAGETATATRPAAGSAGTDPGSSISRGTAGTGTNSNQALRTASAIWEEIENTADGLESYWVPIKYDHPLPGLQSPDALKRSQLDVVVHRCRIARIAGSVSSDLSGRS